MHVIRAHHASRRRHASGILLALAAYFGAGGCALSTAAAIGVSESPARSFKGQRDDARRHFVYNAQLGAAALVPVTTEHQFRVGIEATGLGLLNRGSSFHMGGDLGYELLSPEASRPFGLEAHIDSGIILRGNESGYVGCTVGLPITISPARSIVDRNKSYRFVNTHFELVVPRLQGRAFWTDTQQEGGQPVRWRLQATLGVALRLRLSSDLF